MGAEALKTNELSRLDGQKLDDIQKLNDLEQGKQGKMIDFEFGGIRHTLLERVKKNQEKGIIAEKEEQFWKGRIFDNSEDMSRLRGEIEDHERKSIELKRRFDSRVHGAEEIGMLRLGEHEKLDNQFLKSELEEKEKLLKEFEKELSSRQKKVEKFYKLEKAVQEKRRNPLEAATNYDEKLKILESAESENALFKAYRSIFEKHKDKIGKKTRSEYYEWFLTLSGREQEGALRKAIAEDIKPREKTWDIHSKLPKKYQSANFLEMGLTERKNYLNRKETEIEEQYRALLRKEGKGVFSPKSIKLCEQAFEIKEIDLGKRLLTKIDFLEALPGHIKAEKKLWEAFEKLKISPKMKKALEKKFEEYDFKEKKEFLEKKGIGLSEAYTKGRSIMNSKLDPKVSEIYQETFEDAESLAEMNKVLLEAVKFQQSKDRYFKKWDANSKYFKSDRKIYEKWYTESVRTFEDALSSETELDKMIIARKNIHQAVQNLPPHIRARMNMNDSLSDKENQLKDLQKIAEAYISPIPLLLATGQNAEKELDFDNALKFYTEALKLDPSSPELQALAAHAKQKGGTMTGSSSGPIDEENTKAILKEIDHMPEIQDEIADQAHKQILLDLTKMNEERIGAGSGTTKARAKAAQKGFDKEKGALAEQINETEDLIVDETETVRTIKHIKMRGAQTKETEDELAEFFDTNQDQALRGQGGAIDFAFVDDSGREMERTTAQKYADEDSKKLEAKIIDFVSIRLAQEGVPLTAEQKKALNIEKQAEAKLENTKKSA